MATASAATAVKSLNKAGGGRRRFVFKTFSQRIEEINIDVYRSLVPLKAEPSEGSSFFLDCLVEYRELNTAEDFISFYEETLPLVQTLPQIILQKDLIVSNILSRLIVEGRLSLEPILRLLAALSRDLLDDFIPYLPKIADSLESLLESGADKDPEIIEQIFTSWSYIMMYLQKYLIKDIGFILRVTAKLRYYPKDYIREFMAESVSFLLRKTPIQQLKKGITTLMSEVVDEPSEMRTSGVGALLSHVMRITPLRLHSRKEMLMAILVDVSIFQIGDQSSKGSNAILEVLIQAFQRLDEELDSMELTFVWKYLCEKITDFVTNENLLHLSCLLALLISTVQSDNRVKISDFEPMVHLADLLVRMFVIPHLTVVIVEPELPVIEKVLRLMLCIIDGLLKSKNMVGLQQISLKWEQVFDLRSQSLLDFIKDLLTKDPSIVHLFGKHIIHSFNNMIETSNEEVVNLMINFCEKLEGESSSYMNGKYKEKPMKIHHFFEETLRLWTGKINEAVRGNLVPPPFQQTELAVLWGIIRCYSCFQDAKTNPSSLMDLINAIDELMAAKLEFGGISPSTWQSLIGEGLHSYHKLAFSENITGKESAVSKFLDLAKSYKSSPQILSAVANFMDSISGKCQTYLSDDDALDVFAENLCHANKEIRLCTLRLLCYYEPHWEKEIGAECDSTTDASESSHVENSHDRVLSHLKSIEETILSIETSRKVILLISKIQTSLNAHRVPIQYIPVILNGIIGIFHNRFSYLWNPALECLTVLIEQYCKMVWNGFITYLEHCQTLFLASRDQHGASNNESNKDTGLLGRFSSEICPKIDSTPLATVLSLLIQSLQKVPSIAESHSRQIIPLFFKFLGYNIDEITSDVGATIDHKGKEWKGVLKDWLSLFRLFNNPRALYQEKVFKDVLLYRLLDQSDADIQMKVLDCLMNWKDDFLVPYGANMKNLINGKTLRDELTRWSLSRNSVNAIDGGHRAYVVPVVIRILIPKVRNLKALACQKNASVNHRKAVLGFLTELDVDELPLFFWLLMKPLISYPQKDQEMNRNFWNVSQNPKDEVHTSDILKHFTSDCINALPWKKKYGFLHVVEDIIAVFDESHLNPFLDLLMNCVARILASCTSSITNSQSDGLSSAQNSSSIAMDVDDYDGTKDQVMERTSAKQFKDLRSLCLKIINQVLSKYDDHDFGPGLWDLFFTSVKPLIANFKQEVASSEKPSSLFHCFLAMSKSYKLVPLLGKEESLVPDIFSILTVPSATESILSCVLKFIKNLLKLDGELDGEDATVKGILLPHFDVLVHSLYSIFSNDGVKRSVGKVPIKMELTIFKLLSKYVRETLAAEKFVDILLPLLAKKHQSSDTCVEVLQIIRQMVSVLGSRSNKRILNSITPLLISSGLDIRISICDLLDTIAANDSSVSILATILHDLNATSNMEMGGLDYDKILAAYDKVNLEFFRTIGEEHMLPILAHSVHDISSGDLVLRQSALRLLLSFIEFCGEILNGSSESEQMWSKTNVKDIVNNFVLKHMGNAMDKDGPIKKVWIDLLREMVLKLPEVANLDSYKALCSDDAEQDFFSNVVHLQKHRRARALTRFKNVVSSGNRTGAITNKVIVPLLFSMLFDVQDGKDEHIRSACIDALASISHSMKWSQYYSLLLRCFRDLTKKPDKQKIVLRLICSILDHFHFSELHSENKAMVCDIPDPYAIEMVPSRKCTDSIELPVVQTCLVKNVFPKIQKLLSSDSENINVNTSLVALKVLKLLPNEIMDSHLPTIIHRVSNFLKNRLESVRDDARLALTSCLKELGVEYLQFIVKVLKGILKRGFESHVLGYTLNFMLSKLLTNPMCGKLDYCLEDLLSVVENDILGDVSDEKEVEKIASKMKETRKQKSFETIELIAKNITFKTHALKLLLPVTSNLKKQLTPKIKSKLENMLNHIASGIEHNPSANRTELFVFSNCLIQDGIEEEGNEHENAKPGRLINVDGRYSHLITAFGLGVLQNYMKKLKLDKDDAELLSLLDPFISLLGQCLSSKYENITTVALRCLSPLVKLPLPSLQSQANKIKNSLFIIAQGSIVSSNQLMEACIKLLTMLLRSTKITLTADELHMLIQFPLFVDLARNPSFVALSLLKAIVHRKLVVPEIYDVIQIVAELMVQSQQEPIRKKCSQILLQFLLGYHLSEKRLQQHLDFLLANLRFEHSTGREAVLEMLHVIILKFPRTIVDTQSQTMFMHLVISLANDDDSKVRSMTAAAIKCLIGHVSPHSLHSILEYSLSWYLGGKHNLWAAAAQVLGLLVEVMGKKFEKHSSQVLPTARKIFQSALSALTSNEQNSSEQGAAPFWKEAYYSLVMFEKILNQFPNLFFDRDLEDIWEAMWEFLLHPHLWLRNISNRIMSYYFTAITTTCRQNNDVSMESFVLMRPSILFYVAVSLCCQLNVPQTDDSAGSIILQNLVFSIGSLQSRLGQNGCSDIPKYWSGLDRAEQDRFLKAFSALDPKNGKRTLATFTSDAASQDNARQHPFVSYLLQKMGKLSFQMEVPQMKIVFNCYKSISSKLLGSSSTASLVDSDNLHSYAYQMLLPLYRVCEGYTGKVISDDVKHLANEVCESIRDTIGVQNFVQIYSQIRKTVKGKRDKRKQDEKIMAVVNPTRNAKRKLRIAEKHRAHKKRKIMSMKMGRWMH